MILKVFFRELCRLISWRSLSKIVHCVYSSVLFLLDDFLEPHLGNFSGEIRGFSKGEFSEFTEICEFEDTDFQLVFLAGFPMDPSIRRQILVSKEICRFQ